MKRNEATFATPCIQDLFSTLSVNCPCVSHGENVDQTGGNASSSDINPGLADRAAVAGLRKKGLLNFGTEGISQTLGTERRKFLKSFYWSLLLYGWYHHPTVPLLTTYEAGRMKGVKI